MPLWNSLGQAATVAQLAGVDAGGLISAIVQAVQTVQRNKVECRQLVNQVTMIRDLLQMLQQSDIMQRPEIRRELDGLEETLRQAYMLVTSCQQSNIMHRFFMSGNQAQQFQDVRNRIDSHLRIYPLIIHIDLRHHISGLCRGAHDHTTSAQGQASEEVLGSFSGHFGIASRTEDSTSHHDVNESTGVREVNETYTFEEQQDGGFTIFRFSQLAECTNNFSSQYIIGKGGYGDVYKGILPNGVDVAIKTRRRRRREQLCGSTFSTSEFENEAQIIPKLQHANIIKLLGCCIEGANRILVYEYMPRVSLHRLIRDMRAGLHISWPIRFQIIEGIAQGTVYLHRHSRLRIIHGDLKPQNILLDHDFIPRITDFGIAEVLSSGEHEKEKAVVGTWGYMDPEYFCSSIITTKSDVYAFGIIVLEIITANHASTFHLDGEGSSLIVHARELYSSGREMELIDPSLRDEPEISQILECVHIALQCVQENGIKRPTMSNVLLRLKYEYTTLPVPSPRSPQNRSSRAYAGETAGAITEENEESSLYLGCYTADAVVVVDDDDDTFTTAYA